MHYTNTVQKKGLVVLMTADPTLYRRRLNHQDVTDNKQAHKWHNDHD
jgi:hypothetical protein